MRKFAAAAFVGLALLTTPATADPAQTIARHDQDTSWLFIATANGVSFDGKKVSLTGVAPHVAMFTERPRRVADTLTVQALVDAWAKGGDDSFRKKPPNAGITVWANGAYQVSVVVLSNPAYDGTTLSFDARLISGELPKSGEHTSVFIDGGCSPWDPRC